ncbi:MAG: SwmB domain-containing protein, partial [Methylococcales bacterium]|nr:SwmB domain-containing protein [Methylococcales bacterium]
NVPDTTPPVFQSAASNAEGTKVILTYDGALSATTAAAEAFVVSVGGGVNAVTAVTVNGSNVELTLTTAITNGQAITVAYTDPTTGNDANAIQDAAGNDVFSLSATSVTNTVPTSNTAPTISSVPNTAQAVTTGTAAQLDDFTVADIDGDNLTVTLTATNGTIGDVTDADLITAGIQLTGSATTINIALAAATFTASNAGTATIGVSVTDGIVVAPTTATYNLTATNPPAPTPTPEPVPPPVPVPTPTPVVEKPVSKDVESQVPSASQVKGDGNGDGISDVDQKNVISLPTQKDLRETIDTPKVYLSIELPPGQILTKAEVKPVSVVKDEQISFKNEIVDSKGNTVVVDTPITQETAPFGLFEFNFANVPLTTDARGNLKGGTTDVKLYLDDQQIVEKYLKQTVSGSWESIPFTYAYDEKLGKTVVSISLTDGDKFDLDGKIDGGIFDPGVPIITPKLTVAPIPVELPTPIEKVFVGYGSAFELTSGAARVFGSSMREVLTLKSGASNVVIDQNVEQVNLAGKFADYTFEQQGNSLKVINNSTIVAKVFVQDDSNGTLLGFSDGLRSASFSNATIAVADKIVPADDIPLAILQKAGVYLTGDSVNPLTIGSDLVNVYGSLASADTVGISAFATNVIVDSNVEQVNFAGKFTEYGFIPVGNSLNVMSGTTQIANILIQDDSNGTILNFVDGVRFATFVQPTAETPLHIEITGISHIS